MIVVHCFEFQNKALSSFSGWCIWWMKSGHNMKYWNFSAVFLKLFDVLFVLIVNSNSIPLEFTVFYCVNFYRFFFSNWNFSQCFFQLLPVFTNHCSLIWSLWFKQKRNWKGLWDKVFKNGPSKICGRQPLKVYDSLTSLTDFSKW